MEPPREMGMEVAKSGRKDGDTTTAAAGVTGAQTTLVKYDTPFLISVHDRKKELLDARRSGADTVGGGPVVLSTPAHCSGEGGAGKKETEEILNTILPPREWKDEAGNVWHQMVSTVPATRQDVISLEEQLNLRLKQMQARETGICPIRRELYAQCFDELIRQVTINCAERGVLLLRVRDEINMTLLAYRTLYESSTAYGMRKALMAESGKSELEAKISEINSEKDALESSVADLEQRMAEIETKYNEVKSTEDAKHAEEIAFLKKANQQIKQQLEAIVTPKKG